MPGSIEVATLYGGDCVIEYDDDAHSYKHKAKGIYFDGVTSILKVLAKDALVPWAGKMAAESFEEQIRDYIEKAPRPLTWRQFEEQLPDIRKYAASAWMRKRDDAGDVGTIAHDYAQGVLTGQLELVKEAETNPQVKKAKIAVDEFYRENKIDTLYVERILCSLRHWYAGRADWIGCLNSDKLAVNDFKTSKPFYRGKVYLAYALQLAAYAIAYEEEFGQPIDEGNIIRLDKKTGKAHIHNVKLTKDLKDGFLFCRGLEQTISRIKANDNIG